MRVFGMQYNSNPVVLEVASAEFDIFTCTIIFRTVIGETWVLPFKNANSALMVLHALNNEGSIVLKTENDPNYMLYKENENEPRRQIRRGLAN